MRKNRRIGTHFEAAICLGRTMQPTALAILEQEVIDMQPFRKERELRSLSLRHLHRFPLDAPLADIGAEAAKLIASLEKDEQAKGGTDFLIDITGTGRPAGEVMRKGDLDPIFVTITGGSKESETAPRDWNLSKNDLVGGLQVFFEDKRFRMAKEMPLVEKLVDELHTFSLKQSAVRSNDPESWRERPDDDLVFAVAIAAWWANRYLPKPPITREKENRAMEDYRERAGKALSMHIPRR